MQEPEKRISRAGLALLITKSLRFRCQLAELDSSWLSGVFKIVSGATKPWAFRGHHHTEDKNTAVGVFHFAFPAWRGSI